ncbi:MAG: hypothetical protein Q9220_004389 [cf. Caloplaca sp. 1 TL-2023]
MAKLTWLVTGCSSGFGEQAVHSILARGDNVIATGRKADERLAHLKGTGAAILDLDVSAPEKEIFAKAQEALRIFDGIDVLMNNAGYTEISTTEEMSHDRWLANFNTNFFGAVNLTRALIPHMREKRSGTIVNIGSIFGWQSNPCTPAYNATKSAMESFTQNLNLELSPFNIRATCIVPGHFRTSIAAPTNAKATLSDHPDYEPLTNQLKDLMGSINDIQIGDPKAGVERILDVVRGEGMAQGREMPSLLPLGSDAVAVVRGRCEEVLQVIKEWEEVSLSTDFDKGVDGK